jgi:hypothetical protein
MLTLRHPRREGLVIGLIGYAAVALFYSAFDVLAARGPLFTVNMLGRALFRGLRDPAVLMFPQQLDTGAIFLYNALHLVAALCIGMIVIAIVAEGIRHPERRALILAALVGGGVVTVFVVAALTESIRPLLPWWSIVVANVLAAALAGTYLMVRHRPRSDSRVMPAPLT